MCVIKNERKKTNINMTPSFSSPSSSVASNSTVSTSNDMVAVTAAAAAAKAARKRKLSQLSSVKTETFSRRSSVPYYLSTATKAITSGQ